jgi:hypothetical protein
VGGGCYGRHHARSLARARERGEPIQIWVVDRDARCAAAADRPTGGDRLVVSEWDAFLDSYLDGAPEEMARRALDGLVLPPLAPHLFARWLAGRAARRRPVEPREPPSLPELPYASFLGEGGVALSHAAWRCPTHCIEPWICPATRQERDWELARSLVGYTRALRESGVERLVGPLVSRSVHWREGVGVALLGDWFAAEKRLEERLRAGPGHALVATASACHGVAHLLRLGVRSPAGA